MSTDATVAGTVAPQTRALGSTDVAIVRRAFAQVWIGAAVWALAFGVSAAASALNYVNAFPTAAGRRQMVATTAHDTGLRVLLGPVDAIGSVGGYTVYKCFAFLTTIGAIWGMLAATRLLRGEEDAGRWQLVLAGNTRAARATAATLVALGSAVAVIFAGTTVIVALVGRNPDVHFGIGDSVMYALSIAIVPAVFVTVGAVTAQLGRTRRFATGLGIGTFGVMFVLRMIGDSGPQTRWMLWLTPFGWTELVRPITVNDPWPLLPAAGAVLVLGFTATWLAGRRDAGTGILSSADVAAPRAFGLGSPFGLAARLELPGLGAWCAGSAAAGFCFGMIAKVATGSLPKSVGDVLDRFGVQGRFVNQYLGVAFLFVALVIALIPAGQIGGVAEEETGGRMVHLLVGPAGRATLLGGRLALAGLGIVVAAVLAGCGAWLGATSQGVDVGIGSMLTAALNVVPTALVTLGIGAVTFACAPRAAVRTVYTVVIGSVLIDLLASMIDGLRWLRHVSLFHYMALAPAQHPDPTTLAINVGVALALAALALVLFSRRDLRPG